MAKSLPVLVLIPWCTLMFMYLHAGGQDALRKGRDGKAQIDSEPKNNLNAKNVDAFYRFDLCYVCSIWSIQSNWMFFTNMQHLTTFCNMYVEMDTQWYACKPSSRFLWYFFALISLCRPNGRLTVGILIFQDDIRCQHFWMLSRSAFDWNSQQPSGIAMCYFHEMAAHFELNLQHLMQCWFILLCLPQRSLGT
jgi:hypothetical protein